MPEPDPPIPASSETALRNRMRILMEEDPSRPFKDTQATTQALRSELAAKGFKGFRRGGKVEKTGPAMLHKGEEVLNARAAKRYRKTRG